MLCIERTESAIWQQSSFGERGTYFQWSPPLVQILDSRVQILDMGALRWAHCADAVEA